jgi:hypothetical protein
MATRIAPAPLPPAPEPLSEEEEQALANRRVVTHEVGGWSQPRVVGKGRGLLYTRDTRLFRIALRVGKTQSWVGICLHVTNFEQFDYDWYRSFRIKKHQEAALKFVERLVQSEATLMRVLDAATESVNGSAAIDGGVTEAWPTAVGQ